MKFRTTSFIIGIVSVFSLTLFASSAKATAVTGVCWQTSPIAKSGVYNSFASLLTNPPASFLVSPICSAGNPSSIADTYWGGSPAWTWTCLGIDGGGNSSTCVYLKPSPFANITASPTSVVSGGRTTLTWTSMYATSCTATGPWSNLNPPSGTSFNGSGLTNPLTAIDALLYPYQIFYFQCSNPWYTSPRIQVRVNILQPINGACSSPQIHYSCIRGTSINNVNGVSSYTWSCAGLNGGTTASCSEAKPPTATLTASPTAAVYNGRSALTWSSTGATSCTTSGNWSTSGNLSGSGLTDPLTANTTFTFQCTGPGGTTALQSVTVTVPAPINGVCSSPQTHYFCTAGTSTDNVDGSGAYTWSCAGLNGGTTASCSETKPAPTASLTASPTAVDYNGRSALTWSSTNATSCTAGGPWGTSGNLSGSGLTDPLTADTTFTFQCTGPGGTSALQSVQVTVAAPTCANGANNPPTCDQCPDGYAYISSACVACTGGCTGQGGNAAKPTGSLACNNFANNPPYCTTYQPTATLSASPDTIDSGQSTTLTWSSTEATSCTAVGGFSTGDATSGDASTGVLTATQNYQTHCIGDGGSVYSNVATITVRQPNVSISADPMRVKTNSGSTISWSATDVQSCAITKNGAAWQTGLNSPGTYDPVITTQTIYTITCQTSGVPVSQSVIVNIQSFFQNF